MAPKKQIKRKKAGAVTQAALRKRVERIATPSSEENFSSPDPLSIKDLLSERKEQRSVIFWFAIRSAAISLFFLITIVAIQSFIRIFCDKTFTLLSGHELEVLSVAIFGQILGVVHVITKSLWDHTLFKDFYKKE